LNCGIDARRFKTQCVLWCGFARLLCAGLFRTGRFIAWLINTGLIVALLIVALLIITCRALITTIFIPRTVIAWTIFLAIVLTARLIVIALLVIVARLIFALRLPFTRLIVIALLVVVALLIITLLVVIPLLPIALLIIIAAVIVTARLLLLARGFNQICLRLIAIVYNGKAADIGLITIGIIAALWAVILPIIAVFLAVAITILTVLHRLRLLALLLFGGHLAVGFGQHAGVMFGVLAEIFRRNPVIRPLRIACQHLIFFDNLLRRATHLAFGARAVEDAVDDIAEGARAVRLRTRARLGRAHLNL
jgi:hypothetical protein